MSPFYYVLSVNGLVFLLSLVFYFYPPKKVNNFYGYRTPRSMANQNVWEVANSLFNKFLLQYSAIALAAALVFAFIAKDTSWQPIAIMVLTLGVCVVKTEQELNKHFDKEGNKLKK
ncbi:SdpI/YhfL family protein [Tenacibaculum skagerrakense]|uniref:SdpI/YhfL family protein n=1 Tax=Tenacibaculum skagerrakense TaxID=186571 RepID=A0A4R2NQA5_9FLAO|nr:SdpI family protein [Tenacibaculum skagerrakense]TCP23980.1 SdpI/YhfL family protein [Tenacibaculum skagerrakense]